MAEGAIGRDDVIKDDLLTVFPQLAEQVKAANVEVKALRETLKAVGTAIPGAKSTNELAKSTEELALKEKELFKIQKQIEVSTARATKEYQDQQKVLQALKKEQRERLVLGQKDAKQVNELNSSVTELEAALNKNRATYKALATEEARNTKEGKELKAIIDQQDASVKKLNGDLGDFSDNVGNYADGMKGLKLELKAARDEMVKVAAAAGTDSKEFADAATKAGEIKDKISDLNDALKNSSSSKFENIGNSLKDVGAKLLNLDFEGASTAAKQFATVSKSLTFKEVIEGLKSFGNTLATVGKAILTNPLFIIVGVITAAVLAFKYFRDEQDKASQRAIDRYERETEALTTRYDVEIKLQKIAGKQTFELEKAKQQLIINNAKKSIKALGDVSRFDILQSLLQGRIVTSLSEDKLKQLGEFTKAARDAANELTIITAEQAAFEKQTAEDLAKQKKQDLFELNKFRLKIQIEAQEELAKNEDASFSSRLKAVSKYTKLKNQLAKLEYDDAISQEKLTADAILLIQEEYRNKILVNKRNANKEEKRLEDERLKAGLANLKKSNDAYDEAIKQLIKDRKNQIEEELLLANKLLDDKIILIKQEVIEGKKTREQGDAEILALQKSTTDEYIQNQIDRAEKLLKIHGLTTEETLAIDKELAKLRLDLQNAFYNQVEETDFQKLQKWASETESKIAVVQGIYENFAQAVNTAFTAIADNRIAALDAQSKALEDSTNKELEDLDKRDQAYHDSLDSQLENETLTAEEKKKLKIDADHYDKASRDEKERIQKQTEQREAQLEQRRRAERRKTAQVEKITGIFSAGISAALAVLNALSTVKPYPAAVVAAISAGVLGAVQVAAIASKPLPAFFTGVDSAPGGLARVGEQGSELMREPGGKFKMSPVNSIMDVKAGTKIWNRKDTLRLLALNSLNTLNTLGKRADAILDSDLQYSGTSNHHQQSTTPTQTNFYASAMEIIQVDKFNDGRIARRRAKIL